MNQLEAFNCAKKAVRDCRHCLHVGEDVAGGTNQLFCTHPDTDFYPHESSVLLPNNAVTCDFYECNHQPGLYFHHVPPVGTNHQ